MSEPSDEFITTKTCPTCGKKFTVLWPHQWAYRRYKGGGKAFNFYCSWSCLRALDREKEEQRKAKKKPEKECVYVERAKALTQEQKDEAVRIAIAGGDYLGYLSKTCGMKAPANSWSKIKKQLKEKDPETWADLQGRTVVGRGIVKSGKVKAQEAVAKAEIPEAPTLKVTGAVKIETPEKCAVVPGGITLGDAMAGMKDAADDFFGKCKAMGIKTICDDGVETKMPELPKAQPDVTVSAIRHKKFGEFYRDFDHNCIDWRTPEGEEVSMSIQGVKELYGQFPELMKQLGVEL